jgi:Tol biopolymer transport system component
MTINRDLDRQLASWFEDRATSIPSDGLLERSLGRVGTTRQRPGWLVRDRGRSTRTTGRPALTPAFGARLLVLAIAVVAIVIGAGLFLRQLPATIARPSAPPSNGPLPSASIQPTASPAPSPAIRAGNLIAYIRPTVKPNVGGNSCGYDGGATCPKPRLWIIGTDGRNAHELLPDGVGRQADVSWSPDGTHLLYWDDGRQYLMDPSGSAPQLVDNGCAAPCYADTRAAFSSDGTRLVFVLDVGNGSSLVATMDLASGRISELISTEGTGSPAWSPDGTQISISRAGGKDNGGPIAPIVAAVFVVGADGSNLHQVSPATVPAEAAAWSPDGSRIVFTSNDGSHQDIYTVRSDGSDPLRLTTDGISKGASWTPDGRILFFRGPGANATGAPALWVMNADGTGAAELIPAAGIGDPKLDFGWPLPAWQPIGGPALVPMPWTPLPAVPVGPPQPTAPATPQPSVSAGFGWTGSMGTPEDMSGSDTATLLADGRVLVIHPCNRVPELYDPATGAFSPTGSLVTARSNVSATRLRDGRVLVAGGAACGTELTDAAWATAELYDPATGRFSPTGSMGTPRFRHGATLLADGRVLITGGTTGSPPAASLPVVLASYHRVVLAATGADVVDSAELYDPATGRFSPTGSMRTPRDRHTATLLHDGRVLVVGGAGESYSGTPVAELYDPATGGFASTGSMLTERWGLAATLLHDGRVLITGGTSSDGKTFGTLEAYDPTTGKFRLVGSMPDGTGAGSATLLADGRVLLLGGMQNDGSRWNVLTSAVIYDPATGAFTSIGSIGEARSGGTRTLLNDGRVLIAGGLGLDASGFFGLDSALLYQP